MTKLLKQLGSWAAKKLSLKTVNNFSTVQPFNRSTVRKVAFTLAEVLITLTVIGIVAALTIPTLIANTNEKGLNTSDSVFQRRLGEALKVMNLQGTLAGHGSTQAFVDELGRHMKIIKTCPSDKLTECFVSEFKAGKNTIQVEDLKTSTDLYNTIDYGTETIGVVFGNGIRALIAYNKQATQNQFDNSNTTSPVRLTSSGTGKDARVLLSTDSLSILYNLQERKNNNVYGLAGNIRGKNISAIGECIGIAAGEVCVEAFAPIALNCKTDPSAVPYCGINKGADAWDGDYWAGANKACKEAGGSFPSAAKLAEIADEIYNFPKGTLGNEYKNNLTFTNSKYGILKGTYIWHPTEYNSSSAQYRGFNPTSSWLGWDDGDRKNGNIYAICVGS